MKSKKVETVKDDKKQKVEDLKVNFKPSVEDIVMNRKKGFGVEREKQEKRELEMQILNLDNSVFPEHEEEESDRA